MILPARGPGRRRRTLLILAALALGLASGRARAGTVDATQTTVLGNSELLSMGGAGLGFATGPGGLALSPAAVAHRREESAALNALGLTFRWAQLSFLKGSDLGNLRDLDWRGRALTGGLSLAHGRAGLGLLGSLSSRRPEDEALDAVWRQGDLRLGLGLSGAGGRAVGGLGARLLSTRLVSAEQVGEALGLGAEGGLLLHAPARGLSGGLTLRSPIVDRRVVGALDAVEAVVAPAGGTVGLGWSSRQAAPADAAQRLPVRVAADLEVAGPVASGEAAESLILGDETTLRGARWTASPRLGLELEPLPGWLRLRGGGYLEPARVAEAAARLHGTGGIEIRVVRLRLFHDQIDETLVWRCGVDLARRYQAALLLGLDAWHSGVVGGAPPPRAPALSAEPAAGTP